MTEKELVKEFWHMARECEPWNKEAFEAYITGNGPWPKGIKYTFIFPDEVAAELDGKYGALALRIVQAALLSTKDEKIDLAEEAEVRVLRSLGRPFKDVYKMIKKGESGDRHGTWNAARNFLKYYSDEIPIFLDELLADPKALDPAEKLSGINTALVAGILGQDSAAREKYKSFIPLIEAFVAKQVHEDENDIDLKEWFMQREHNYCGHLAAFLAGDCSPVLKKLRLRILFNTWFPYCPYSGEELWEMGKKIGLPDEWFELLLLQGDIEKTPAELAAHFNTLYKENRPLFEKTHRVFYWQLDGKTLDDEVPCPSKKSFRFSLYLLAIKLANGEGQKEIKELAEHWDDLIEIKKDAYFCDNASSSPDFTRPFAAIYESGIPGLDKLFDEKFAKHRKNDDDRIDYMSYIIRFIIDLRKEWRTPESTVQALHTANRISVEEFHNAFNAIRWNLDTADFTFPSDIIRDYTRLHPEETKAWLEGHLATVGTKTVHSEQSEDFTRWLKAVFSPGGQDIKDAVILFGAKSKRALNAVEELLLNHEDEVRTELEAALPKLKKDASEAAQRLIARWNAMPGAVERAAKRVVAQPVPAAKEPTQTASTAGAAKLPARPTAVPVSAAVSVAATPSVASSTNASRLRSFIYTDDKSNKFWNIEVSGVSFTVTFGRVGSAGQVSEKSFDTEDACTIAANKLIAEKTRKGYVEQGTALGMAPKAGQIAKPAAQITTPAAPATPAPAAKPPATKAPAASVPAAQATGVSGILHRSFIFEDGKSGKFWTIKVKGSNLITIYGRVGSDGEKTEKDFDTEDACAKEAEKLIAEKTKKGYVEQAVAAETAAAPVAGADPAAAAHDAAWEAKVNPARKKLIAWIPEEIFAAVRFADGKTPAPNALRFVFAEHILLASPIPLPECAEIVAALDKKSVQQALKALYEAWLFTGADAKKKAVLIPYCFYTPINELLALKKQIYDWIDAARGALAAFAAECFAANGDDLAFLAVDEISQKAGNKQVKKAARSALLQAASDLGITLDELLDKIVPTLEFDSNGKRILDFGPRQFEVALQKDFSVALTDLSIGKPIKSLPAPNAKDDKEKAAAAKAELTELRKFIKAVVKSQTMRLERVLIDGRPWKIEAWKKLFVENPIMRCFASNLIWGAYETISDAAVNSNATHSGGKLLETFRYMDDGTFNTAGDTEYTLPETAAISLAHPIEMGEKTTAAWKQQLEDYEIIQSIKQLEVKVIPLKDEDIETEKNFGVRRYLGNTVPESALTGLAKKYDMERGPTGDGGSYYSYTFNDTWLGLSAAITFDGPYMGGGEPGELQYAYFYKLPGTNDEDPMDYGEIAKGAGLDPRTLPQRFVSSILSIFDNLLKAVETAEEE